MAEAQLCHQTSRVNQDDCQTEAKSSPQRRRIYEQGALLCCQGMKDPERGRFAGNKGKAYPESGGTRLGLVL